MKKKTLISIIAVALILCVSVGGALAWLTDKTQEVTNTFTVGNIGLTLTETDADGNGDANNNNYKMVPGQDIAKDPQVTVAAESEDCWVFIKVTKENDFDKYLTANLDSKWAPLGDAYPGVYYYKDGDNTTAPKGTALNILSRNINYANGFVTVNTTVTKADMDALSAEGAQLPKIKFTAYAIQKAGFEADAAAAWDEVSKTN